MPLWIERWANIAAHTGQTHEERFGWSPRDGRSAGSCTFAPVGGLISIREGLGKRERYETLLPQVRALVADESDLTANLGNILSALHMTFRFHWTGLYRVVGDELVLGPFQGPVACTRIARGRGVCGTAWVEKRMINVPDVEAFPGHIACSALSRSELVAPIRDERGAVRAVLDIDSDLPDFFDAVDESMLAEVVRIIENLRGW